MEEVANFAGTIKFTNKENSDRCHYYNGKWNKKDLAIGISSIVLGSIAKYFITLI